MMMDSEHANSLETFLKIFLVDRDRGLGPCIHIRITESQVHWYPF